MKFAAGMMLTDNLLLESELGAGGMGAVWIARNTALGNQVAVKVLAQSADASTSDERRARFEREARGLAKLDHPHIVRVFDYGMTPDGDPFIVMELLKGEDLASRLTREGPLDPKTALAIIGQSCRALGRAHAEGIVHRDIKPANIFLVDVDGEVFVKLLDFGVAKFAVGHQGMTQTGALIGTPRFMSPEQFMSPRATDHRSDLWAMGAVAYACLTGRVPFDGETLAAVGMAISMGAFERASFHQPGLPGGVDAWMQRALCPTAAERFQTAKELSEAFECALQGKPFPAASGTVPIGATRGMAGGTQAGAPPTGVGRVLADGAAARTLDPVQQKAPPASSRGRASRTPRVVGIALGCVVLGAGSMWFISRAVRGDGGDHPAAGSQSAPVMGVDSAEARADHPPAVADASASSATEVASASAPSPPALPIASAFAVASASGGANGGKKTGGSALTGSAKHDGGSVEPASSATDVATGNACSKATQCTSGYCVDGVCCDVACNAKCFACTGAKKLTGGDKGSCGFITGGADPDNECPGAMNRCNGNGDCAEFTPAEIFNLTGGK